MPIDLPPLPRLATVSPQLLTFGANLQPPLGGPTQRVRRLGSRFAVGVQLPSLDQACAGRWIAALMQAEAEGDTLRLVMPQLTPSQAAATVNGANWLGTQMAVSPLSETVLPGALFSFVAGGRAYLHEITVGTGQGGAAIRFAPQLRVSPPNGAALNFAAPVLEGYADPGPISWQTQFKRWSTLSFTLTENR